MSRQPLKCHGAPRDLGLDQGLEFGAEIRREARGAPGRHLAPRDERTKRVGRDVLRYFPHMAERAAGLARGARVTRRQVAGLLSPELADRDEDRPRRASAGVMVAVPPERTGTGALIARCLDLSRGHSGGFALRRSAPDGDYASVEVVLPWLVPATAGVNEHGLAAAITSAPPSRRALRDCAAPAALLVQDCLQRFDRTDKAVEWCQRRPAGGAASILLADASGDVASVIVEGSRRSVRRPSAGLLLGMGRSMRRTAVEKSCLARERCDREALVEVLSSHDGIPRGDDDSPCRHGDEQHSAGLVLLDPEARALHLLEGPPCRTDVDQLQTIPV